MRPRKAETGRAAFPARSEAVDQIMGREIGQRRRAAGLSRNDFAGLLGVTQRKMKLVESGASRLDPSTFLRAVQILGVLPSDIFHSVASAFTVDLLDAEVAAPPRSSAGHAELRARLERIMDKCEDILRIIDLIDADKAS